MKLQLFASTNSCNILRKYIKKAKENKKNDKTTITSKPKLHAKEPQKSHKTGKFIYASVKFVKTPQNQVQSLNSTKNIKFTISEINSLSNFNFFQPKPILKDEKPIKKETFCLV